MTSGGEHYELVVRGRLGPRLVSALQGFEVTSTDCDSTHLQGWVADQSALHGILKTISDLHLQLESVRRVPERRTSA